MAKYRKKPIVVETTQWFRHGDHKEVHPCRAIPVDSGLGYPEMRRISGGIGAPACNKCGVTMTDHGWIDTLEGGHIVCPADWIITGISGENYPCKPDIFEKTYELVEE